MARPQRENGTASTGLPTKASPPARFGRRRALERRGRGRRAARLKGCGRCAETAHYRHDPQSICSLKTRPRQSMGLVRHRSVSRWKDPSPASFQCNFKNGISKFVVAHRPALGSKFDGNRPAGSWLLTLIEILDRSADSRTVGFKALDLPDRHLIAILAGVASGSLDLISANCRPTDRHARWRARPEQTRQN